jgi:LysM repeat protein
MRKIFVTTVFLVSVFIPLVLTTVVQEANAQPGTAYDLLAAVNALRTSQGLTTLEMDPILMAVAQSHSEYQASLGYWTHEGPGGTRPRDRAMAAGYGGGATVFISENVAVMNPTASFDTLIYSIWSDALHWNTMTNPSYTHAGVGIAVSGNEVYYTLDVGYVSGSPGGYVPGAATYTPASGVQSTESTSDVVSPVITATPQEDGSVIHRVEPGQSLWSIAIAYNTTILEIVEKNNLDPDNPAIWPGTELLIQPSLQPSLTLPPTSTKPLPTRTPHPSNTPRPPTPTRTPTQVITPTNEPLIDFSALQSMNHRTLGISVIVVCALGLIIVIITGWFRSSK